VVTEWKEDVVLANSIQLKNERTIKTILYAGDQALIAKSEDKLQITAHR
jgi:hypothetical protein